LKLDRPAGHTGHVETKVHAPDPSPGRLSAEDLFRAHAAFVASFVVRLGVDRTAVDDVVQEVFLTVHRRGGYEVGPARPTTWLAEIAIRVVSTHKRSERRRRTVPDEDVLLAAVSRERTPLEAVEQRAALARMDQALAALDVNRRAVFILYELEGESCDAIAAGFGVPVGTVHSRLFAARRELIAAYERLERTGAHTAPGALRRGQPARGDGDERGDP
jgi:RNA polymerase sigma-70 factor, ECF subfamily